MAANLMELHLLLIWAPLIIILPSLAAGLPPSEGREPATPSPAGDPPPSSPLPPGKPFPPANEVPSAMNSAAKSFPVVAFGQMPPTGISSTVIGRPSGNHSPIIIGPPGGNQPAAGVELPIGNHLPFGTAPPTGIRPPDPKNLVGRKVGKLFLGIGVVVQVGVISFLVFKKRQIAGVVNKGEAGFA